MTAHVYPHPDTHQSGLFDGCPRCVELAEFPFASLDKQNLETLIRMARADMPSRSLLERHALDQMDNFLLAAERMAALGLILFHVMVPENPNG